MDAGGKAALVSVKETPRVNKVNIVMFVGNTGTSSWKLHSQLKVQALNPRSPSFNIIAGLVVGGSIQGQWANRW